MTRILVTNDDGVYSEGLRLLARALAPIDDEPETAEEAEAVAEGLADLERGAVLTTEQQVVFDKNLAAMPAPGAGRRPPTEI